MHHFKKTLIFLLLISTIFSRPIIIKLATVAPEGTEYYNLLLEMGQRWQQETNGQIQLRIYPNGVVGGERDTIRKMRVGQIQASAMSSIGLAERETLMVSPIPSIRSMPIPSADLTLPVVKPPASVIPK